MLSSLEPYDARLFFSNEVYRPQYQKSNIPGGKRGCSSDVFRISKAVTKAEVHVAQCLEASASSLFAKVLEL